MRWIRKILLVLLVVFLLIQFLPRDVNKSSQILPTDFTRIFSVPGNVEAMFKQACYDCHSNNTNYPWYANVQPFRLMLDSHVKNGKEELNFSEYGSYSPKRQHNKLTLIEESLKKETMPLRSYTMMHSEARLSVAQKEVIIKWVDDTRDSIKIQK